MEVALIDRTSAGAREGLVKEKMQKNAPRRVPLKQKSPKCLTRPYGGDWAERTPAHKMSSESILGKNSPSKLSKKRGMKFYEILPPPETRPLNNPYEGCKSCWPLDNPYEGASLVPLQRA